MTAGNLILEVRRPKPAWLIEAEEAERQAMERVIEARQEVETGQMTIDRYEEILRHAEWTMLWHDDCRIAWRRGETPESLKEQR